MIIEQLETNSFNSYCSLAPLPNDKVAVWTVKLLKQRVDYKGDNWKDIHLGMISEGLLKRDVFN